MMTLGLQALLRRAAPVFLVAAVLFTLCVVLIYAAVENDERSAANDPQIQIATQAAWMLNRGKSPADVTAGPVVEVTASQAVHVSVYGRHNRLLASNARLGGAVVQVPAGVLIAAHRGGENLVTWQPTTDVRIAAVAVPWRRGTVLVGRSLSAAEHRETALATLTSLGWLMGMVALVGASLVSAWLSERLAPAASAHG